MKIIGPGLKGSKLNTYSIIPTGSADIFCNYHHHQRCSRCIDLEQKFVTFESIFFGIAHEFCPAMRMTRNSGLLIRI
ncbi:hypothetical protein AL048_28015 [Pseudomonas syringae pv. castaneae]|nr:hypothetical protein AL048_28015 [Pseudomonas syringae pv. castaneae]